MKRTRPVRTIELDAGVHDFLWRYLEACRTTALQKQYDVIVPEYLDMVERGLSSFRASVQEPEQPPEVPVRRQRRRPT